LSAVIQIPKIKKPPHAIRTWAAMELTYASQIRKLGARNAKTRKKRVLGVNLDYGKKVSFLLSLCQEDDCDILHHYTNRLDPKI
jgi:hypothetical protein